MVYGYPPFYGATEASLFKKILACEYDMSQDDGVSEKAKDFIRKFLVLDPKQRLNLNTAV